MDVKVPAVIEKATKLKEGEIEFVVSTGALDAHGEKINVDGIKLKDYKLNPVVLWAHDGWNLPIAKTQRIWKSDGKLMAKAQFYMKDLFPRKVYNYIVDGFLNAVSIGGQVDEWGEDGTTIERLNMKEFSVVSIPANPEALVSAKTLDTEEKSELTGLAKAYARQVVNKGGNELLEMIENQKMLLTALQELAVVAEPQEVKQKVSHYRVMLSTAQGVDHSNEKIIRKIKVKLKDK